ncbi:MAG: sugar ABC transporter permease [Candidatus Aerophobus sp.]|nr:MAG: sugar ABC transporter permease [Candidatus Aerophobus sp.]
MYRFTRRSANTFIMMLPLLIILAFFSIYPFVSLIQMSFSSFSLEKGFQFSGLKNFTKFLGDNRAWDSIVKTFIYVFTSVSLEFLFGLGLALTVKGKYRGAIRTILIIPMLVAPVAVGIIWRLIYDPSFGVLNSLLQRIGIQGRSWLADPKIAIAAVIVVEVWQFTPFVFLILLAGLESLPSEIYEAAKVDGASPWQTFRYLTLPLLSPIILIALLFRTAECFKSFDKLWVMTAGGPGTATEIITMYIYRVSFRWSQLGYGALLALIMVIFIVIYNSSYMTYLRKWRKT